MKSGTVSIRRLGEDSQESLDFMTFLDRLKVERQKPR